MWYNLITTFCPIKHIEEIILNIISNLVTKEKKISYFEEDNNKNNYFLSK